MPREMKTVALHQATKSLRRINREIRYKSLIEEKRFTSGLIAFRFTKESDRKQINHPDKDVVCHVLKGRGRLRVSDRTIPLRPGIICHIPKGTAHDFAAAPRSRLLLFYFLVQT